MKKLDLDRKEPLMISKNPQGNNRMTSRASFYQKKSFEVNAYKNSEILKNKALDLWYDRMLYGRIDQFHNTIQIKQNKLKQVIQNQDTVLGIDFAVDAFQEFADFWNSLQRKGVLDSSSPYFSLHLKKGWEDINKSYFDIMGIYYQKLQIYIKQKRKDKAIINFKSFLEIFTDFLDEQTPFFPILRSTTNTSRFVNPNTSGVVFDLKNEDFSDDSMKIEKYIEDKNYLIFKETAIKYGFIVDKHAPWRIFADLTSPAMKPYMDKYNVTMDTFFDEYYTKLIYPDLDLLKLYVIQMYNAYIGVKPSFQEPVFAICSGRTKLRTNTTTRGSVTPAIIELQIPEETWLRFYVFIKAREQNLGWTQTYFEQVIQKVIEFKNGLDIAAAFDYIASKTKIQVISNKLERSFRF